MKTAFSQMIFRHPDLAKPHLRGPPPLQVYMLMYEFKVQIGFAPEGASYVATRYHNVCVLIDHIQFSVCV